MGMVGKVVEENCFLNHAFQIPMMMQILASEPQFLALPEDIAGQGRHSLSQSGSLVLLCQGSGELRCI